MKFDGEAGEVVDDDDDDERFLSHGMREFPCEGGLGKEEEGGLGL